MITAYVLGELLWHAFGFFAGIAAGCFLPVFSAWKYLQRGRKPFWRNQKEGMVSRFRLRLGDPAGRRRFDVAARLFREGYWLGFVVLLACLRMYVQEREDEKRSRFLESTKEGNRTQIEGGIEWMEQRREGFVLRVGMLLLYVSEEEAKRLQIGDRICAKGRIRDIEESCNPGEFDADAYYRSEGIFFAMRVKEIVFVERRGGSILHGIYLLRMTCRKGLERIFSPEDSGFLAATLLGDRSLLDRNLYALYQRNGIAHLLAISGLHVSMLGLFLYYLLRKILGMPFPVCGGIAGAFLVFYGIFTGASVSVTRAFVMLLLVFIAEILGRSYDLLSAASIAAFAILLHSPGALFTAGFLLSFTAVLSIGGPLSCIMKEYRIRSRILSSLAASICIQAFTLPLSAYYFFRYPPYAFLLNLLVIPLMGILIALALLSLLLLPFCLKLSLLFARPAHWILRLYLFFCETISDFPGSSLLLGRPGIWQILLYYTVLGGGVYFLLRLASRDKKDEGKKKRKTFLLLLVFMQLPVLLLFPVREEKTKICFLDVGQGDGIYMRVGGEDILIDCGSTTKEELGRDTLKPFLQSMAVDSIEKIFITHADKDHISALLWLFTKEEEIGAETLYLPCPAREDEDYLSIREAALQKGMRIVYLSAGENAGPFLCLSPRRDVSLENTNEQSIVLLYRENRFRALFTGDAGKPSEEKILADARLAAELGDITLLKVGHHGSYSASGEEFVRLLSPDYAVLSYGKNNPYGHPHREVLARLWRYDVKTYETAKSGEIEFLTDGERIWIREWKKGGPQ